MVCEPDLKHGSKQQVMYAYEHASEAQFRLAVYQ
jgi:hypothetical protein